MFVRAKRDFDCPSHSVRKAQVVDIPEAFAVKAIEDGDAVAIETERAIDEVTQAVEKRAAKKAPTTKPPTSEPSP